MLVRQPLEAISNIRPRKLSTNKVFFQPGAVEGFVDLRCTSHYENGKREHLGMLRAVFPRASREPYSLSMEPKPPVSKTHDVGTALGTIIKNVPVKFPREVDS